MPHASVRRRRFLTSGTLIAAFTGVSTVSGIATNKAYAAPGDKTPPAAYVPLAEKGVASGVATLGADAKVPSAQLPNFSATFARSFGHVVPAYRKRIIHNLPFKSPSYAAAKALWGDYYPQTFTVDAAADELFIVSANTTSTRQVVSVYVWSTGAYKRTFAYDCTVVSEGAVLKTEAGKRYLYVRTGSATLSKYDITSLPPDLTRISAASAYPNTSAGVNFTYANGFWTANDSMPPIGGVESRGYMKRMDDSFNVVGQLQFSETYSGGNSAGYRDNALPKMQGFIEAGGKFILAIGGNQNAKDPVTPYGYQGIRIISGQGEPLEDALIRPDLMMKILADVGLHPTRVESEGVVAVGGSLYTLTVTSSYNSTTDPVGADNGGLLIMEEFSTHPDAIDFSPAAVTWTQTPADRLQSGLFPRGADGKMHNPVTNEILDTVPKILGYMKLVNQAIFRFYSSSTPVLDATGALYPNGNYVTILDANNSTYFVNVVGTAADTSSSIVYEDGANPGQYITKRYSPRGVPAWVPAKNRAGNPINTFVLLMAHMIDVGQTVYSFYSSNLSITDINGTTIPAGAYVNAYNPNNSTFYFQVISSDATYPAWVKAVPNGSGGFNQTTYTPRASSGFYPINDATLPLGSATARWSEVYAKNGIILNSPDGTKYRISVANGGAISAVPVP